MFGGLSIKSPMKAFSAFKKRLTRRNISAASKNVTRNARNATKTLVGAARNAAKTIMGALNSARNMMTRRRKMTKRRK
jgi:hypothetical protein